MVSGNRSTDIDRRTLREQVVDRLTKEIVNGRMAPGSPLTETLLSEDLGVSRGTVREAIRHLQQEGLVTMNARGTVHVRELTAREIGDIYSVRAALEGLAVTLVADSPKRAEHLSELRRKLAIMDAAHDHTFGERIEADLDFHRTLCALSGNETLLNTWLRLGGLIRAVQITVGERIVTPLASVSDHQLIIDAIDSADSRDAFGMLQRIMAHSAQQIQAALATPSAETSPYTSLQHSPGQHQE